MSQLKKRKNNHTIVVFLMEKILMLKLFKLMACPRALRIGSIYYACEFETPTRKVKHCKVNLSLTIVCVNNFIGTCVYLYLIKQE